MSESTDDQLAEFHAALARLKPTPDGIDLAQLMYRAGRLSARRWSWAWPSAAVASMMLAATLGFVLLLRPVPQPTERIVTVYIQPPPAPTSPAPPVESPIESIETMPVPLYQPSIPRGESDYLRLRRDILTYGLDALPPPTPWPSAPPAVESENLLDLPKDSREPWIRFLKHSLQSGDPT